MATPDLRGELGLSEAGVAMALFTGPLLLAAIVEPVALVLTARVDRRRAVAGALLVMAATQAVVAAAGDAWSLAVALGVWGTASGVATTLAEVALVARAGERGVHRVMTRWALAGSVGDLTAPALYAACAAVGLGWRTALGAGALVALVDAATVALGPPLHGGDGEEGGEEEGDEDGGDEQEGHASWREVARSRVVWAWLLAAATCTLFDEILVAYASLWLREGGADAVGQGVAVGLFAVGTAVGQVGAERLLPAWGPRRLLLVAAGACAVAWVGWLALPVDLAVPALVGVGVAAGPMWSLATAEAYAAARNPAVLATLGRLLAPLDLLAPLVVGTIAGRWGLLAGLLALLLQPLAVAVVAGWSRRPAPEGRGVGERS